MIGVIGEDKSDVDVLTRLIRRLANDDRYPVKGMGYTGSGELFKKGPKQLRSYYQAFGCVRFVICYDADRDDPEKRFEKITDEIIDASRLACKFCALVPIQEIEAWILADINAVSRVITSWTPNAEISNPESINDPKEHLRSLSKRYKKPLYSPAVHNAKVAAHLDLDKVFRKCQSFRPLAEFVKNGVSNVDRSATH